MLTLLLIGCADITDIEDGRQLGPVVVLKDWFTSAALLPTDAGPVLIDAGYREGHMEGALADQGVSPEEVIAVLLTHGHTDHTGAAALYPSAQIHALAEEEALIDEESGGAVALDVLLTDGEILTFGQHSVEVFSVPGHTAGSAVYLIDGALMLGDTAQVTGDGSLSLAADKHAEDNTQADESLRALAATLQPRAGEIDWLVPSHTGASPGLDALLTYAGL